MVVMFLTMCAKFFDQQIMADTIKSVCNADTMQVRKKCTENLVIVICSQNWSIAIDQASVKDCWELKPVINLLWNWDTICVGNVLALVYFMFLKDFNPSRSVHFAHFTNYIRIKINVIFLFSRLLVPQKVLWRLLSPS